MLVKIDSVIPESCDVNPHTYQLSHIPHCCKDEGGMVGTSPQSEDFKILLNPLMY